MLGFASLFTFKKIDFVQIQFEQNHIGFLWIIRKFNYISIENKKKIIYNFISKFHLKNHYFVSESKFETVKFKKTGIFSLICTPVIKKAMKEKKH